jgi:hypothetical protein
MTVSEEHSSTLDEQVSLVSATAGVATDFECCNVTASQVTSITSWQLIVTAYG